MRTEKNSREIGSEEREDLSETLAGSWCQRDQKNQSYDIPRKRDYDKYPVILVWKLICFCFDFALIGKETNS